MIKKAILIIVSLTLVQGFLFAAGSTLSGAPESAPAFTLLDLENKQFSLSDFKGKPIILFFWTTWCPYCLSQLKLLNSMYVGLLEDGVEIVSINEDEFANKVPEFIKNHPLSYRILLDTDNNVARAFGVMGVPTYILINKEGRIVFSGNQFLQREYKDLILR
ncbi:MAG: TlpA disulfide reductase family protein [Candidatus Omnitrophota bacterium]